MGNLGEKCGKEKSENSMKLIYNVLSQQMMEQQMIFINDAIIYDFEVRKENEEFPESTTFMLENLNFKPDEFGYVEPEKPPEEPKPTEEELKK
jgi:3-phosphoglycerate kinase